MQKPVKKIKNGNYTFSAPSYTAPYSAKGWFLESYTLSIREKKRSITELRFSNGETIQTDWLVPPSRQSVEEDIKGRYQGYHFGGFPKEFCFESYKLDTEFIDKGSDAWKYLDPLMEKRPDVLKTILEFPDSEGKTQEDVKELYKYVVRFGHKMPSSWKEYEKELEGNAARAYNSMHSAPSKKDEL